MTLESKLRENGREDLLKEFLLLTDVSLAESWLNFGERLWDECLELRSYSVDCFMKAANGGCARAQCRLAGVYENGIVIAENFDEACRWYLMSANQGFEDAQYALGWLYSDELSNPEESEKWFLMSFRTYVSQAKAGNSAAAFRVGFMFMKGLGVERDQEKSEEFYLKASQLGDQHALFTLGVEFRNGTFFKRDPEKAVRYFKQAADAGNKSAYYALAEAYESGDGGVVVDLPVSLFWYEKCVEQGSRLAVKKVKEIQKIISENLNEQ